MGGSEGGGVGVGWERIKGGLGGGKGVEDALLDGGELKEGES